MLEQILKKLNCTSIKEFVENENDFLNRFSGMHADRDNPFLQLTDEEMDYFETHVLPKLTT